MRLVPSVAWRLAARRNQPLDARLLPLLAAIRAHATLRAAAAEIGVSYRAAWSLLGDSDRLLGLSLVALERGRGARLTAAGERLVAADARATQRLRDAEPVLDLALHAARAAAPGGEAGLTVAASHDLLFAALYERWARPQGIVGDLTVKGSTESLAAFARGEADLAGFHAALPVDADAAVRYRALLDPRRHVLIRFAEREQGLIVPKGNPRRLRSLADVAAKHARFVNRQRGSGTRLLTDRLLELANLAPSSIRGYDDEEHTHLAVAATVAAGRADVGLGLKAAAARFGLGFVPLRREIYWLAARARRLESDAVRRLREGLAGEPLRRAARGLPGYSIRDAGAVTSVAAALA
jgi:molybdate transport repressor ModE-like protein